MAKRFELVERHASSGRREWLIAVDGSPVCVTVDPEYVPIMRDALARLQTAKTDEPVTVSGETATENDDSASSGR